MYLCRKRLFHALILIVGLAVLIEFVNSDSQINPYKVLGLSKNANEKQIRNAYKKLAKGNLFLKYHLFFVILLINRCIFGVWY